MSEIDETHDPALQSWVESANGHPDFPIQNLPLGVFSIGNGEPLIGVAIGDMILNLKGLCGAGLLDRHWHLALGLGSLNAWFNHGPGDSVALRIRLSELLSNAGNRQAVEPHLVHSSGVDMHLPCKIGDYTDFYVGIHHATNVGKQFRPDNPLLPNYKYVPIGYHGRASSIRPSGGTFARPHGQRKAPDADAPVFGPTRRLDYELEMAIWIGKGNSLGQPVPIGQADAHIAGLSILNDWSARDLQAWESQPLGPFLAKSFYSTVSPWLVTSAALQPFRTAQPARSEGDPAPLPYLFDAQDQAQGAYAVTMEVHLLTAAMRGAGEAPFRLSRGPMTAMYWTAAQLVAHHSVNGCNLNPGDLLGTGTLSGAERESLGSLLELTKGGKTGIALLNGERRTFLLDGDEIIITAMAQAKGYRSIGFGECRARIAG